MDGNSKMQAQAPKTAEGEQLTGAEIVLRALADQGVDTIFGYPGGAVLPIYDAIYAQQQVRHILVRHEQGAGHMAEGYARSTGKCGVALATSGPGATNMVTGIATAMMDSSPIVCITGQVGSRLIGSDAFQETDLGAHLLDTGELFICGMMTQNCVTYTALAPEATVLDRRVIGDLCTAPTDFVHQVALVTDARGRRVAIAALTDGNPGARSGVHAGPYGAWTVQGIARRLLAAPRVSRPRDG